MSRYTQNYPAAYSRHTPVKKGEREEGSIDNATRCCLAAESSVLQSEAQISKVLSGTVSGIGETVLGNNGEKQDLTGNNPETGSWGGGGQ